MIIIITFNASSKSYKLNVDTFLLEMDKLYTGNNWSKTLKKPELNTCEKHSPYCYKQMFTSQERDITRFSRL